MIAPGDVSWVRLLEYSTHVGQQLAVRGGAVRWLLRETDPDLVILTEVQSPAARRRARVVFPPLTWSAVGFRPKSDSPHAAGTLILARRDVFKKDGPGTNALIATAVPGDAFLPERRCTTGQWVHRDTGCLLDVGGVHLWAIGDKGDRVRQAHLDQLHNHIATAQRARQAGRLPVRAGDTNEWITNDGQTPAEKGFASVSLRTARPAGNHAKRLDEIFVPLELPTRNYAVIHPPRQKFPNTEWTHPGVVVDVGLTREKAV